MELNLGQWVVIGISGVLILAYIRGFYYNRQRAKQIQTWLEEGLKIFGPISPGDVTVTSQLQITYAILQ